VATYNVYLGADLSLVFGLDDEAALRERTAIVHGQLVATRSPDRARAVAALLVRERPDLVGLQEVTTWTQNGQVWCDFLAELTTALTDLGEPYDVHAVDRTFTGRGVVADAVGGPREMALTGSNVVLRRAGSRWRVTAEGTGSYAAVLQVPTAAGTVVPIARGWSWVAAEHTGHRVLVVTTHTEAHDATVRDAQRDSLLAWVDSSQGGGAVVLLGDLNATPDDVGMPAGWTDAWLATGGRPGHTCCQQPDLSNPVSRLRERIDYVFARGATVRAARLLGDRPEDRTEDRTRDRTAPRGDAGSGVRLWPSDHAAVVADLTVDGPGE
jgi:endonuclease/exonuclease/phosphatase family metal-dependent hydrolase